MNPAKKILLFDYDKNNRFIKAILKRVLILRDFIKKKLCN